MLRYKTANGFTLLELVAGMAMLAIGMAMFTAMLFPMMRDSFAPAQQIKAAEFAQSLLQEAMAQPYDETTPVGGIPRCDSANDLCSVALGVDANDDLDGSGTVTRDEFDDVDDYNQFCNADQDAADITGNNSGFTSGAGAVEYSFRVCVIYDGDYDGETNAPNVDQEAKLITVSVSPPRGQNNVGAATETIKVSAYRSNY